MAIDKLNRRKGVIYRVRLTVDGKRISKCFDRKIDAVKFSQEAVLDTRIIDGLKLTFGEAATEWLEYHARPRKAPSSVVNDEAILEKELTPYFGKMRLADIQPHHIDTFIARKMEQMSNASVNRRLERIRAIFNYHMRRRAVSYNPMSAVAFLKVDPKPIRFWSLDEARCFLKYAEQKYMGTDSKAFYVLYLTALNTGMRMGELLALKWSAIDLNNRLITVCRTLCHHTHQVRETTKGRRIRHVPINDSLLEPLRALMTSRNGSEWVFHTNGSLLDQNNIRNRHWKVDKRESGVTNIRFHDLRHTYASHFMMNGGDIFKLQAILGHADIRTTMQYSHFSKAFIRESANIAQFDTGTNVVQVDFGKTGTEKA